QLELAANGNPILLQTIDIVRQQAAEVAKNAPKLQAMIAQRTATRTKNASRGALNNPDVFHPPGPKTVQELDRFEKIIRGPMPLPLRQFYEQAGCVNLMGHHETLNPRHGSVAPDPLVVFPYR